MKILSILYYLVFFIYIIEHNVYASAWLIDKGKYRYTITTSNIDKNSKYLKQTRTNLRLKIEQKLEYLRTQLKLVNNESSAHYKILSLYIKSLEKEVLELLAYQDLFNKIFTIEYGINQKSNLGIQFLYKDFKLQNKQISGFYKVKLFQNNTHIISLQPKIIFSQNTKNYQQFSYEVLLLSGRSRKFGSISIFSENSFSIGTNLKTKYEGKNYYTFSSTEGIKFENGIMIASFLQYHLRKNHNYIYNKTLFVQLSIAKQIKFDKLGSKNLTMQIGYFVDRSLINKNYKLSGIRLSAWTDI